MADPLIWCHGATSAGLVTAVEFVHRLQHVHEDIECIVTRPADLEMPRDCAPGCLCLPLPTERGPRFTSFLRQHRPSLMLWMGDDLVPRLIDDVHAAGVPMLLLNGTSALLDGFSGRWIPGRRARTLNQFERLLLVNHEAAQRYRRVGVDPVRIEVSGVLSDHAPPPTCDEAQRDRLAENLKQRPLWLANAVQKAELDAVLTAHRQAQRRALRLLLVLVPHKDTPINTVAFELAAQGWSFASWSGQDQISDDCEILLCPPDTEMGLWYRLAPVTFLGSSLRPWMTGQDPFAAAALGSALIFGKHMGRHADQTAELAAVGAGVQVSSSETLVAAVKRLLSPELAASAAHAAWDLSSRNAHVTDRVIDVVVDLLDLHTGGAS